MRRVPTGTGLELAVRVWEGRAGAAPPVVLLHGFMGSAAAWGSLPARLARDRTVVVPDLPGHGESDAPRDPAAYRVPAVAAALAGAVSEIVPGPVDWVGYSMGGRILLAGWAAGLLAPRRVVLESTSPGIHDPAARAERRRLDDERATRLQDRGLEAFVESWMALPLFATQRRLDPDIRLREADRRRAHDPAALAACLRGGGTGAQAPCWDALPRLDRPVLLLTGALDGKFDALAAAMESRLPRARRTVVPDAGHAVHLEAPEGWLEAVRGHLDAPEASPR